MLRVFLGVLLCFGAAHADPVAESIARTRAKLDATPILITDEARERLRSQQEERERQRAEKLLPPPRPVPVLEPSVEQRVVEDLLSQGVK